MEDEFVHTSPLAVVEYSGRSTNNVLELVAAYPRSCDTSMYEI
jgi:hypothetical protein